MRSDGLFKSDEERLQAELDALRKELDPIEAELAARKQSQADTVARLSAELGELPSVIDAFEREAAELEQRREVAELRLRSARQSRLEWLDKVLAVQGSLLTLLLMMATAATWSFLVVRDVLNVGLPLQVAGLLVGLYVGRQLRPVPGFPRSRK